MLLSDRHTVATAAARAWSILMDADSLARIVPAISKPESIEGNSLISTISIKVGPASGSFTGHLQMEDIEPPRGVTLKVQQNSKLGNANASVKISLTPVAQDRTEVKFDGDVKLSGLLATMGSG